MYFSMLHTQQSACLLLNHTAIFRLQIPVWVLELLVLQRKDSWLDTQLKSKWEMLVHLSLVIELNTV